MIQRGRQHEAQHRAPVADERDVDGELPVATDELLGAVDRVDHPEACAHIRNMPSRNSLLCNDRYLGSQPTQAGEDDLLGQTVGRGDRRFITLGLHAEIGLVDAHHDAARFADQRDQVVHQRGKIKIGMFHEDGFRMSKDGLSAIMRKSNQ